MRKTLLAATDAAMLNLVAAPSTLILVAALISPRLSRYKRDRIVNKSYPVFDQRKKS